ncbi:MAG TPA: hypothetical protein VIV40_44390 [Kofleriaceae bacterium]
MTTDPVRGGLRRRIARFVLAGVGTVAAPASARPDAITPAHDDVSTNDDAATTDDDCDGSCDDQMITEELAVFASATDATTAARGIGILLEHMNPFDATRTAALAAMSPSVGVRHALARALASQLRLVGDDLVLDHLAADTDPRVRDAALTAASMRFAGRR